MKEKRYTEFKCTEEFKDKINEFGGLNEKELLAEVVSIIEEKMGEEFDVSVKIEGDDVTIVANPIAQIRI